jgi:N-glycosylase/DNA lyase
VNNSWTGVIGQHWVRLQQTDEGILAETSTPSEDWTWLVNYLQLEVNFHEVMAALPRHPVLTRAISLHAGLRLLRQDPWECLASFILSSNKKIVHIKCIVNDLCEQYGNPVTTMSGDPSAHAFPSAERIAGCRELDLRALRMGFRASYLLNAAEAVASGRLSLNQLSHLTASEAREALTRLPGVGRKIADCVLLFSLGFNEAFPVDVWITRALQAGWFPGQTPKLRELVAFSESYFGRYGGYAQQYLFHHARLEATNFRSELAE